jgi:GTPase involved in cell partitioning and DNA repair
MAVRRKMNIQSLQNLQKNLASYKKNLRTTPWVLQYNKMDLSDNGIPMLPIEMLEQDLNQEFHRPYFPASALFGTNVAATLKKIILLTIASIRKELL